LNMVFQNPLCSFSMLNMYISIILEIYENGNR
jgi:hypothetical protein